MQVMKSPIYFLAFSLFLLVLNTTLTSFSMVPNATILEEQPPIEKGKATTQKERRQQRLNKRYNRLCQRMEQTTRTKQRHRLQKRIRQVERQAINPALWWGLSGMVLSFFVLLFGAYTAFTFFEHNPAYVNGFAVLSLVLFLGSIAMAIIALLLHKKNPEKSRKPLAIIALIVNGLALLVFIGLIVQ